MSLHDLFVLSVAFFIANVDFPLCPQGWASHRAQCPKQPSGYELPCKTHLSILISFPGKTKAPYKMVLACLEAFFARSSKTPSKKQEPLTRPISRHQTAGSSNWRNILASKDIDGGRAKLEVLKLSFSLGISQNKGTEAIQPCSFSSFYLALLAFYVVSLLWFQAFLIFFFLSFNFFSLPYWLYSPHSVELSIIFCFGISWKCVC